MSLSGEGQPRPSADLCNRAPRPFTIGIGLQSARLATIFPQPHDIALDVILTEAGVRFEREGA